MKNYIRDIFYDTLTSIITRKYGNKFNDDQRMAKVDEYIESLHANCSFTIDQTQSIIDKKGFNNFFTDNINGQSVYVLVKTGLFGKAKVCYAITRNKDEITPDYLDQVYDELRRQAAGENVFGTDMYKNA